VENQRIGKRAIAVVKEAFHRQVKDGSLGMVEENLQARAGETRPTQNILALAQPAGEHAMNAAGAVHVQQHASAVLDALEVPAIQIPA
jgi:hypothetical protein